MSTLEVSNLNDGTTTVATTFVTNGSAKMWVNFTGITTTATRDSFNVSSLTDGGTGNTTVTLTNNMNNANYSGYYFTNASVGTAAANFNNQHTGGFGSFTTSSCQAYAYTASAAVDAYQNLCGLFGDLA
tara:strand:+ start:653 stop:1039 length:387 start_codon:yes stop_codon:yes gene_type:complete